MWTKLQNNPRKKAPRKVAVIDPASCFGAFACSICQAACPVEDCIVEEKDENDRWVCAVRIDKCIGCGLCVTIGNPTAPGKRDFGCPADYDAIDMVAFQEAKRSDLGVPSCRGAFTSFKRLVSISRGRGWFLCRI